VESEQQYRTILETAMDGFWLADAEGRLLEVNEAYCLMSGYSTSELLTMRIPDLESAEAAPETADHMRRIREEGSDRFESRHRRKDGTAFDVEVSVQYRPDGGGRFVAFVRDITEHKHAEDEILQLNAGLEDRVRERTEALWATNRELLEINARLEDATRAKSDFLSAMSHELRTPLNSIIGFSSVLTQGLAGPLTDEQRTQIDMVNLSGRHLLSLIDAVLDLAKVEAGKESLVVESLDPDALVREVGDLVRPLATAKGLSLDVETCGKEGAIRSDAGKVRQILLNLLGNAVKFTEHGGVGLAVACEAGRTCAFSVTDTGPGIAAEDHRNVFEPFTQLASSTLAKSKGTGLGLRISREYAHLLGGELTLVSELGAGSTFTLRLPLEPPADAPAE
jgi:PAS domain S-box-containing protein